MEQVIEGSLAGNEQGLQLSFALQEQHGKAATHLERSWISHIRRQWLINPRRRPMIHRHCLSRIDPPRSSRSFSHLQRMNVLLEFSLLLFVDGTHVGACSSKFDGF